MPPPAPALRNSKISQQVSWRARGHADDGDRDSEGAGARAACVGANGYAARLGHHPARAHADGVRHAYDDVHALIHRAHGYAHGVQSNVTTSRLPSDPPLSSVAPLAAQQAE